MRMLRVFFRKLRSAKIRWNNLRQQVRDKQAQRTRAAAGRAWLAAFEKSSAEVLIGANFVDMGGCRQHMHSVAAFSSLKTLLVPDTDIVERLGACEFSNLRDAFLQTAPPPAVKAVHSHVFPWFINWCVNQRSRIPVWVHTHHNWYYPEFGHNGLEQWQIEFNEKFCEALRSCDVPLCVSRWQQQFLLNQHGIRTHYLPNGVDVSLCLSGDKHAFHNSFSIPEGFVLWVGRNDPVKNPADFVSLAREIPELNFCMVGPGLSVDSLINDYGVVVPRNVWFTGRLTQAEVQNAIAACRILVVTSRREGLPTLVFEGLAQQKPMVVPNEDGCMEALGGAKFGDTYEQGDVSSLVKCVHLCLQRPPRNAEALQRVRDEFDWPVIMQRLDIIYRGGRCG
jgi:glycosyltransferase involved in cell wall biosynthesis